MVRKPRIWFPGAKYHITSRGNRKESIFYDNEDRLKYTELLAETQKRFPFYIYTYCLMTNHIHLQIETIDHTPSQIMKYLHTKYAKYFNKRHELIGHVFQERYGSVLIDNLDYELDVSKYIHLNPLKANLVEKLEDYAWSSYRAYVFQEERPIVQTDKILSYFPDPKRYFYENYVKSGYINLVFKTGYVIDIPKTFRSTLYF